MIRVGLLHTVPALVEPFDHDVRAAAPGVQTVHLVDATLLADAVANGVDQDLRDRVGRAVDALVATGVDAVLATCSSIGEAVDAAAARVRVPVLRVDESMAHRAVELARTEGASGRIVVLATLAATLGPTGRLVERAIRAGADRADGSDGAPVSVEAVVVAGAADARAAGDASRSDALVGEAVRDAAGRADVVVLAQASMAAGVPDDVTVPVLTSPAGGVAALAEAVRPSAPGAASRDRA